MKNFLLALIFSWGITQAADPGSVVFLHPDGAGMGHWYAARLIKVGPDGLLNWDRLEKMSLYEGRQRGNLSTSSHAGATAHAYGKKVHINSFGMDRDQPLTAASGKNQSIMQEAMDAGIRCGIVNSGHIGEPGTAVFLASVENRNNKEEIARQIIHSGAEVIFCGGEIYLLPEGEEGVHGQPGRRRDGVNLIEQAKQLGYTVIFTRDALVALPASTKKVLGIFNAVNSYNVMNDKLFNKSGFETYDPDAPTFAELTAKALEILSNDPKKKFFLVAEEEGTDNFANATHARGTIDATLRSDDAIGRVLDFADAHPDIPFLTLLAADSDAGKPSVLGEGWMKEDVPLPATTNTGAELDGVTGPESRPFLSAPDRDGTRYPFGIAWPYSQDMQGGVLARASGYRSDLLGTTISNTGIYDLMYKVLFGQD